MAPSLPATGVTHPYGVRDVERLLKIPAATIRALIAAGFVTPVRGARNAWRFSFQDLIVLRTAQALVAARVSPRRITRSLKELRRHLPQSMPLSGLSIGAVGDRVVVREGGARWQAESGQYLLAFEGDPGGGSLRVVEHAPPDLDECLERAVALHEAGRWAEADRAYREARERCGDDATLFFNHGVLLDDMGRDAEAIECYLAALRLEPEMADAHYNLALLYEKAGKAREAIRHMSRYRRLGGA